MQEWVHCIFCTEVHLSVRLQNKQEKENILACGWSQTNCESPQTPNNVAEWWESWTTWEYFIVEVAGKRQPNKVLLMGGRVGGGGEKVLLRVNRLQQRGGWRGGERRGGVAGLPPHGTVYTTSLKQLESPYLYRFFFLKKNHNIFKKKKKKCIFSMYLHK